MENNSFFQRLIRRIREWLQKLLQILFPADVLDRIKSVILQGLDPDTPLLIAEPFDRNLFQDRGHFRFQRCFL